MKLKKYFFIVLRKIWIIIAIAAIAGGATYYLESTINKPVYESTSTLYIMSRQATDTYPLDYNTFAANKELLINYKEIIESNIIAEQVIRELNLDGYSTLTFLNGIEVRELNATSILEIKVLNGDPFLAKNINDSIVNDIILIAKDIAGGNSIKVIGTAELPLTPVSSNKKMHVLLAIIAGIIGGLAIIFIMEYFDNTIKSESILHEKYNLNILALVPKIHRR